MRIREGVHAFRRRSRPHRCFERPRQVMRRVPVVGKLRRVLVGDRIVGAREGVRESPVETRSLARQKLAVDGLLEERVAEHERLLRVSFDRNEDVELDRLTEIRGKLSLIAFGDAREEASRHSRSGCGGLPKDFLSRFAQGGQPGEQDITQHRGKRTSGGLDSQQLLDEERVPARPAEDDLEQIGIGRADSDGADLCSELLAVEAGQIGALRGTAALELRQVRQQRVPSMKLIGSEGGEHDDPRIAAVASKVGEQVEGRRVGPMDVLDHEHKPSVTRQPPE